MRFTSNYPAGPTDRIIRATALVHGARPVTSDRAIRASGEVNCIW
jgi:PIN domain nuclease of toxin-antitoxin system